MSILNGTPSVVGAVVWGRSARRLHRAWARIDDGSNDTASDLARSAFRKELHTTLLYAIGAIATGVGAWRADYATDAVLLLLIVPLVIVLVTLAMAAAIGIVFPLVNVALPTGAIFPRHHY